MVKNGVPGIGFELYKHINRQSLIVMNKYSSLFR